MTKLCSFSFRDFYENFIWVPPFLAACYIPCTPHPQFDLRNDVSSGYENYEASQCDALTPSQPQDFQFGAQLIPSYTSHVTGQRARHELERKFHRNPPNCETTGHSFVHLTSRPELMNYQKLRPCTVILQQSNVLRGNPWKQQGFTTTYGN